MQRRVRQERVKEVHRVLSCLLLLGHMLQGDLAGSQEQLQRDQGSVQGCEADHSSYGEPELQEQPSDHLEGCQHSTSKEAFHCESPGASGTH